MSSLADFYLGQDRYDEAVPLYTELLETKRRMLGDEHPDTLTSVDNLADLYLALGRYDEAELLFVESLENYRRTFGDDHPRTLWCGQRLATLYVSTGRPDRARPLVADLLAIRRRKAEESKTDAAPKNEYAWAALTCEPSDLRDPESALSFALEANEMTNFHNWQFLDTLALAYHRNGQTAEAIVTQRKALELLPKDDTQNRADFEQRLAEFEAASSGEE